MAALQTVKIKPGTTPVLTVIVDGEAIQDAKVYVTIAQKDRRITKNTDTNRGDIALSPVNVGTEQVGTQILVWYSQAETLFLRTGYASVEVGWIADDDSASKTNIGRLKIPRTLYREVMA